MKKEREVWRPFVLDLSEMQQHTPQEFELFSPPTDGISAVRFAPGENLLLVSSWDSVCFFFYLELL
jgi:hypothetical protein